MAEVTVPKSYFSGQKVIDDISDLFDRIADQYEFWKRKNCYYHNEIERFYVDIIPKRKKVLEIGSGDGSLLNSLESDFGVGLDVSAKMIEIASKKYPHLNFIKSTIRNYNVKAQFDYVVLSNFLEYASDLYDFFNILHKKVSSHTKLVITGINPLWELIINLATKLKMRTPIFMKNFVTCKDIENILSISGYEVIESGYRIFFPKRIFFISYLLNKLVSRLPIVKNLCLVQYIIARSKQKLEIDNKLTCSVIIPCFNEQDNLEECITKVPEMGSQTEILVVDDGSTDDTAKIAKEVQSKRINVRLITYGANKGKGYAVRAGFEAAKGDIMIILDADMAVLPEELTKFYNVLASRQAEFVNGTRMVYDMVPGAMRFINYLGNKIFGILITFIIGQRNTDTLCGTKAIYRNDYQNFRMGKCPWGDFDLLFEAARMKLKMVEMPVHYYPRQKGVSKMRMLRHGALFIKMCWYGFWYLG